MSSFAARLLSTSLDACEIQSSPDLNVQPGQYFMAARTDAFDPLPTVLYPAGKAGSKLIVTQPFPSAWQVGTPLTLRGPLGRGFSIPAQARRVAIVNAGTAGMVLKPWLEAVLERGGEVVIFSDHQPAGLPTAVEGLPLEQAGEAWKWAEYLAAECDLTQLGRLLKILRGSGDARLPDQAEILIRMAMPCGGTSQCGLCAVKTVRGYRLACEDGPVFPLADLAVYPAQTEEGEV
jgi:hypothetical protein